MQMLLIFLIYATSSLCKERAGVNGQRQNNPLDHGQTDTFNETQLSASWFSENPELFIRSLLIINYTRTIINDFRSKSLANDKMSHKKSKQPNKLHQFNAWRFNRIEYRKSDFIPNHMNFYIELIGQHLVRSPFSVSCIIESAIPLAPGNNDYVRGGC